MKVQHNYSLKSHNTFGIDAKAKLFASFQNLEELREALSVDETRLVLGGGSNILLTKDFDGLALKNELRGIEIREENDDEVLVKVGAGENRHEFVLYCIKQGWPGLENLSLIPGSVGAAPMQNIGAYGIELKDSFDSLEAVEISSGKVQEFGNKTCEFGYRSSIFKTRVKGQYIICSVNFRLKKKSALNTSYGAIESELERLGISDPGIADVSQAVINIRQSKLPDPKQIGNAGSFFKNPVLEKSFFEMLKKEFPNIPSYANPDGRVKVPAGWLIEQAGWKGKRFGAYGVHQNQALVLVNYGGAQGADIFQLSADILEDIREKFSVRLEREVNIV